MPIPVAQLQQARIPVRDRVMAFLKDNASQAYSLTELYAAVEGYDPNVGILLVSMLPNPQRQVLLESLTITLKQLEQEGLVISAQQQGNPYFAVAQSR